MSFSFNIPLIELGLECFRKRKVFLLAVIYNIFIFDNQELCEGITTGRIVIIFKRTKYFHVCWATRQLEVHQISDTYIFSRSTCC